MEERVENPHERLNQQFSELEKEWEAMKTGKGSSAVSCITIEEALEFVENTPRNLMLSLQHDHACPEAEMIQMRSPCRRKLFHDSDDNDDETKTTWYSHSTCCSSNVMRVGDSNNKKKGKKKRGMNIVYVGMIVILLLFLAVVMDGFDHPYRNMQINTLVPT